ncbi:odorant receptor 131-2-like [Oryzias melastigma]|uniref:Olfactory receptor 52A1-like n=1 Tax=Oryzias melastigma TaxID=30732 RepID=A0A3B3B9R3_ORYME|nr:odorant receptor 131-2-like [Oryzias melastigma]
MANNSLNNSSVISGNQSERLLSKEIIFAQVLIGVFLCINFFFISTFFRKDVFYTSMRYILFAETLLSDCLFLILASVTLLLGYFRFTLPVWLCIILFVLSSLYSYVTPVTLTAMTLERYVAICMPLRHAELCTPHGALQLILVIHSISAVPCTINLAIFYSAASPTIYTQRAICYGEMFVLFTWQGHFRSAISQLYCFIMFTIIVFSYIKIMKVAKTASGENKKSTWKGLRTVILHGFQLMLSLIQMWSVFTEAAALKVSPVLYNYIRYFNYVTFFLTPRCLSPLIYGLRDELFSLALKSYASCGLYRK